MTRVALLLLAAGANPTVSAQISPLDFDPTRPPAALCGAAAPKLQEARTSKVVLAMTLDASGRVHSFKTESPKGLHLEKVREAAVAIKALQFKPATKDGSPVAVQITAEFDCSDSPAYRTIPPKITHSVTPVPPAGFTGSGGRSVLIRLTVQTDGVPKDLTVIKGVRDDLNQSALDAVRRWRFQPAMKDGKPLEVKIDVSIAFPP